MDSVTQLLLGAAVAGAVAGKRTTPKVLAAGAILGTVPDLDVFISYGDPLQDMIQHRGFSHSLFVLFPFSLLLAFAWQQWKKSDWSFLQLWAVIAAALMTHPLLDSFTSYGTQLFWPLDVASVAISSIFIIDPLYTLPLLILVIASLMWRDKAAYLCRVSLVISSAYLMWTVAAQQIVTDRVLAEIQGTSREGAAILVTPTPLNSVLWRTVVITESSYWEGLTSLLDSSSEIEMIEHPKGRWDQGINDSDYKQLEAFTRGFVSISRQQDQLKVTDLRLGMAGYHPFSFYLAQQVESRWQSITPIKVDTTAIRIKDVPAAWLRLLGNQEFDANLCHKSECG
jgi:inner membrane protein